MTVWMRGGLIEFTALSTGWVYLRGHGKYEANEHKGFWSPTAEILRMESVPQVQWDARCSKLPRQPTMTLGASRSDQDAPALAQIPECYTQN